MTILLLGLSDPDSIARFLEGDGTPRTKLFGVNRDVPTPDSLSLWRWDGDLRISVGWDGSGWHRDHPMRFRVDDPAMVHWIEAYLTAERLLESA